MPSPYFQSALPSAIPSKWRFYEIPIPWKSTDRPAGQGRGKVGRIGEQAPRADDGGDFFQNRGIILPHRASACLENARILTDAHVGGAGVTLARLRERVVEDRERVAGRLGG
jgi:hypothetical protein